MQAELVEVMIVLVEEPDLHFIHYFILEFKSYWKEFSVWNHLDVIQFCGNHRADYLFSVSARPVTDLLSQGDNNELNVSGC